MISGFSILASVLTALGAGFLAYGQELSEHTLSYSSTRPVSVKKVFASKIVAGVGLTLLVSCLAFFSILVAIEAPVLFLASTNAPVLAPLPVVGIMLEYALLVLLGVMLVYSASLFTTLLIRSKLPAVLCAHLAAIGVVALLFNGYWIICLILLPAMLFASYHLAIRYRRGGW